MTETITRTGADSKSERSLFVPGAAVRLKKLRPMHLCVTDLDSFRRECLSKTGTVLSRYHHRVVVQFAGLAETSIAHMSALEVILEPRPVG